MTPPKPTKKLAVVSCIDTRIDVSDLLGIEVGDAHVIRNAGGLITDDAIRSLTASQSVLGTERVAIIMHNDCGLEGGPKELGGFDVVDDELRRGIARLKESDIPHTDQIRGYVFDPDSGDLREVA